MSKEYEFFLSEPTLEKMLILKREMGFGEKDWDEWFDHVFNVEPKQENDQLVREKVFEKLHYARNYDEWVKSFALNLNNIWNESSARELDPNKNSASHVGEQSALVIGAGPSVKKHNQLTMLAESDYDGTIICTDRMLIPSLKAGVTPDKFQKYYVVTIDGAEIIQKYYNDEIVDMYGNKIRSIFSTITHPSTAERARQAGLRIHWIHPLFDYNEGKKSFNQISALMVRAKNHKNGLPALQTGGNVGTSSWFIAWKILKCSTVGLIGINHSWDEDDPWKEIASHSNTPIDIDKNSSVFKKLFPIVHNPEFKCSCVLDPIFQYYSTAFKEFILRSPSRVNTINATEGGCIFGERIKCMRFNEFLNKFKK